MRESRNRRRSKLSFASIAGVENFWDFRCTGSTYYVRARRDMRALYCNWLYREILIRRYYCSSFIRHSPVLPNSKFSVFDDDLLTSKNFCIRYIPPTEKNLVEGG